MSVWLRGEGGVHKFSDEKAISGVNKSRQELAFVISEKTIARK